MIESPQTIALMRDGVNTRATIAWRYESAGWMASLESADFDPVEVSGDDAFEALFALAAELNFLKQNGYRFDPTTMEAIPR